LAIKYENLSFEEIHLDLLPLIEGRTGRALDVGAGSGRDAAWLSKQGWMVTAVEPSEALLKHAKIIHSDSPIRWLADGLPELHKARLGSESFDLILLSAVWMHVDPEDTQTAVKTVAKLAAPAALVSLSVKRGDRDMARGFVDIDIDPLISCFRHYGFTLMSRSTQTQTPHVEWTRMILRKGAGLTTS
jgi:SAM-dependent methyltransferase